MKINQLQYRTKESFKKLIEYKIRTISIKYKLRIYTPHTWMNLLNLLVEFASGNNGLYCELKEFLWRINYNH